MADRLAEYAAKSLFKYLDDNGAISVELATADTDYDQEPDSTNTSRMKPRALPYIFVHYISDSNDPFTIGYILVEAKVNLRLEILSVSQTQAWRNAADTKQILTAAVHSVSGKRGIPLFDFSASNTGSDTGQTMQMDIAPTEFFGPFGQKEEGNLKYRSITKITLEAYKDHTATLLEDKSRIKHVDG